MNISRHLISTTICLVLTNTAARAEGFDWSGSLGLTTTAFSEKFTDIGKCYKLKHSVDAEAINLTSITRNRLKDPLDNLKPYSTIINYAEPIPVDVSFENNRVYFAPEISKILCDIGTEAKVEAYSFEDKIFQIELKYTRCKKLMPISKRCSEFDVESKAFDKELYSQIAERNSYKYTSQEDAPRFGLPRSYTVTGYEEMDSYLEASLLCNDLQNLLRGNINIGSWRCIRDIDSSDARKWSGIAMWERFEPGVFTDTNLKHFASDRIFVDLVAEREAVAAMVDGFQAYISGIQATLLEKQKAQQNKTDTLNSVLGGN